MNEYWKERWVKALRSGRYTQGHGSLRKKESKESSYCCLGVLCKIYNSKKFVERNVNQHVSYFSYNGDSGQLTTDFLKKLDMQESLQGTLIGLNDDDGKNFSEIADYIEENA